MRCPGGHPFVASVLDLVMFPLARQRASVIRGARGRVLELGVGTGLNLPLYDPETVGAVVGIEPDPHMRRRAAGRLQAARVPAALEAGSAEELPFGDGSFDTVVFTWVLCTVPDAAAAVAEAHRVLVEGGQLIFAEHVRSPHDGIARVQDAVDPVWTRLAGGCHLNRDTLALMGGAGFAEVSIKPPQSTDWSLAPSYRGVAIKGG